MKFLFLLLAGCGFEVRGQLEVDADLDGSPIDVQIDASVDGTAPDSPVDAEAPDAVDAPSCTSNGECSTMTAGTCCVDPGSMGHCEIGVVIGGVCDPQ